MQENKPSWAPIAHFVGHILAGAVMFSVLAGISVLLSLAVHWLDTLGVPAFTLWILMALEHAILVIDAVVFLVFLIRTAINWITEAHK